MCGIFTLPISLGYQLALYGLANDNWTGWAFMGGAIAQFMALLAVVMNFETKLESLQSQVSLQSDEPESR